jgi:uncharacterized protein GlcG (DUF336 family)
MIFDTPSVNLEAAQALIAHATEHAVANGKRMCIAVCDEGGALKAFVRMDGATLMSLEVAQRKAVTSASIGVATHTLQQSFANDPPLAMGGPHIRGIMLIGGGYPIRLSGRLVGGIGVSGGHYTDDMKCAEHALRAVGFELPAASAE